MKYSIYVLFALLFISVLPITAFAENLNHFTALNEISAESMTEQEMSLVEGKTDLLSLQAALLAGTALTTNTTTLTTSSLNSALTSYNSTFNSLADILSAYHSTMTTTINNLR